MTTSLTNGHAPARAVATPEPPAMRRPIREIIADLRRPIQPSLLRSRTVKGNALTYLPWYNAVKVLDWYAPGWSCEIRSITTVGSQAVLVVRLTILAAEGDIYREATGIEEEEVSGYGDTSSNAESMALRRAASKFGLALYLYEKK